MFICPIYLVVRQFKNYIIPIIYIYKIYIYIYIYIYITIFVLKNWPFKNSI